MRKSSTLLDFTNWARDVLWSIVAVLCIPTNFGWMDSVAIIVKSLASLKAQIWLVLIQNIKTETSHTSLFLLKKNNLSNLKIECMCWQFLQGLQQNPLYFWKVREKCHADQLLWTFAIYSSSGGKCDLKIEKNSKKPFIWRSTTSAGSVLCSWISISCGFDKALTSLELSNHMG